MLSPKLVTINTCHLKPIMRWWLGEWVYVMYTDQELKQLHPNTRKAIGLLS